MRALPTWMKVWMPLAMICSCSTSRTMGGSATAFMPGWLAINSHLARLGFRLERKPVHGIGIYAPLAINLHGRNLAGPYFLVHSLRRPFRDADRLHQRIGSF